MIDQFNFVILFLLHQMSGLLIVKGLKFKRLLLQKKFWLNCVKKSMIPARFFIKCALKTIKKSRKRFQINQSMEWYKVLIVFSK